MTVDNTSHIIRHASYVAEPGFKLATPGSTVRRTIECTMEPWL